MSVTHFEKIDDQTDLNDGRLKHIGYEIARVIRIAYERAFEQQQTEYALPEGTIRRELSDENKPKTVRYNANRVVYSVSTGSIYHFAWAHNQMTGLAKTSPSWPNGVGNGIPNCYVNDIAVVEEGGGLGSEMMHRSLKDYPSDVLPILDAFAGNKRVNDWYERLGYVPVDPQPDENFWVFDAPEVGGVVVPQIRLQAPSVGFVLDKLAGSNRS